MSMPAGGDFRFPSGGSHLRRWFGPRSASVGFTLDHGTVGLPPEDTVALPPPASKWFEHPLGEHPAAHFTLDRRKPAPRRVATWLHGPLITRGLPQAGPGATISGGSPALWFDVLVHTQAVGPLDAL